MVPATVDSAQTIPTRPRFAWDGKFPLWTDVIGVQLVYVEEGELWGKLHDLMKDHDPNKLPCAARGFVLLPNYFGRVHDRLQNVGAEVMDSNQADPINIERLYKSDSF